MKVLVAGAGKMARNVGFFLLRRGMDVAWVDRNRDWLDTLEKRIGKDLKRLAFVDEDAVPGDAGFHVLGDPHIPRGQALLETIEEDREAKRTLIESLKGLVDEPGLVLTNSSSILPGELGRGVTGVHFFYPVDLTGFVEMIGGADSDPGTRQRTLDFLESAGLQVIEQGPENAFAVNRLLLPVQNACIEAVMTGADPRAVDEASVADRLPAGTLSLMDAVGLDTVLAAAGRYVGRMDPEQAGHFTALLQGLEALVAMDKRGTKNRDGLLRGRPLPWTTDPPRPLEPGFGPSIAALFDETCRKALESGDLDRGALGLALKGLFGVDYPGT